MTDPKSSQGESPFDVEMGTSDAAGAAFQASFVGYTDMVFFPSVNIRRAKIEAGLVRAFSLAQGAIDNAQMGFFLHPESIQEKFIFHFHAHFTLLQPSQSIPRSLWGGIRVRR
jgi:hypothetical protein